MYIKYIKTLGYLEGRIKAYEHMLEKCKSEESTWKACTNMCYWSPSVIAAKCAILEYKKAYEEIKNLSLKEKLFFNERVN